MADNPIQYTSRTFSSILNDINNDAELASKPNWWRRLWAGIGDVLSIWLNSIANLLFLRTAYTRSAVADLCELIDYALGAHTTSSGIILFYVRSDLGTGVFPFTVTRANLTAVSPGSISISSKKFSAVADNTFTLVSGAFTRSGDNLTVATDLLYTGHKVRFTTTGTLPAPLAINTDYYLIYINATTVKVATSQQNAFAGLYITLTDAGTGTHTWDLFSKAISAYQQEYLSNAVAVGTSDGITEWQQYTLPDTFVLPGTLVVTVNSVVWTQVDTFIDSSASDTHYKMIPLSDNQFAIRFGNGVYGAIPGNFDIYTEYATGGGATSNVSSLNRVTAYAGSDSNLTGVTNATVFSGGADEENIASAKRLAPLLLKTRDRFITVADGKALVEAYGGVVIAEVVPNVYGTLSAKVFGIASGGGNPSTALKSEIQAYLLTRTILGSIDVRFVDCVITAHNVNAQVKLLTGYLWANVSPYITLAFKLFFSETGTEIKYRYEGDGIDSAITLINSIFSTSFTSADYSQISTLIENLTPRTFGETIQQSDVLAYIDSYVIGVDYLTLSAPSFPVSHASDEISTVGTVTVTQI